MLWDGHSGISLPLFGLAHALLVQAIKESPTTAARNLARFLSCESSPGLAITALLGISVERRLLLGPRTALVPTKELPGQSFQDRWQSMTLGGPPFLDIPDTALVIRSHVRPKLLQQGQAPEQRADWYKRLKEISLWLTLVGPCAPIEMMTWWQMDEWVPMGTAFGWTMRYPLRSSSPLKITGALREEAKCIFRLLSEVPEERRIRLRVPLERLNSAIREQLPVDRFIDLGIALESLLLEENERDEITFRLSLRGGWLLGRDADERRRISDTLRTLYGYRSTAVHRGTVVRRTGKPEPADVLKEGLSLAARAGKIIATKGFPDWTALLVGGEAWTNTE